MSSPPFFGLIFFCYDKDINYSPIIEFEIHCLSVMVLIVSEDVKQLRPAPSYRMSPFLSIWRSGGTPWNNLLIFAQNLL